MLTTTLAVLFVVGTMDCPMGEVLSALQGQSPPPEAHVVVPPPQLDGIGRAASSNRDKLLYGQRLDHWLDSDNFTVQWMEGDADLDVAAAASSALETSWSALVDDQAWPQPVSSDIYLLWVILDPAQSGTGYTTVYTTQEFPQGYPVIYLNPEYIWDADFFSSLCAHEFNHALQFRLRGWQEEAEEAWYWEASAEWGAELALPDADAYASSSGYYSSHPWYRYSSTDDDHQYGMFVVNTYIEEFVTGPGGMLDVWLQSETRPGDSWLPILEQATGTAAADLWGGFAGAMSNELFEDSALYQPVAVDGALDDGLEGRVALLGTNYFEATGDLTVSVLSPVAGEQVLLSGPLDWGDEVVVHDGDLVGVTGLTDETAGYLLTVEPRGDTGDDDDADDDDQVLDDGAGGCRCSSASRGPGSSGLLLLMVAWGGWRRRISMAAGRAGLRGV